MDELGLKVLSAEMQEDMRAMAEACQTAKERLGGGSDPEIEAAAFHLARVYNILEQMALRVAKAFENRIDETGGWHIELLRRLSLEIPGVRPALFPQSLLPDLQELRAFRHIFRHAYDLALRPERFRPLLDTADRVSTTLPGLTRAFIAAVARQEGWDTP
ncbi:MAG: hypothetical protein IT210_05130 [Armatimonadetes bacterium]|nr:hypothetical protein [Armatimonadota bacterium]